ncbi:hypothetical protein [Maribacter aestuarii]|uniref:hypothetical protein n=1 Tax=Maribacter aestuarii TaxID=1130723 RepID=UPI0025A52BCF|nr:hypothetical protein [Maribacter aestuarii]
MEKGEVFDLLTKYRLLFLALLLLFVSVVLLQVNYNKNNMHNYTVDEYFTITTVHPKLTPDKTIHRALNGPRMFTYLFYPGAMVGMINHMGGNIYEDGWKYPGHNYFVNNYKTSSSGLKKNMEDPNFRYFHYYLKLQAIVFLFLSFIPLVYLLWKQKYYVAMFMVATLVGINLLALEERSLFYIEPLLMAMMNLLIWLYFFIAEKKIIGWFWIVFSSFLFAITISLKFSSLFIIVLIAILLLSKFKTLEKRLSAGALLIVCSLFFFSLINWNIFYSKEVFNMVIHDYFSNFWQYATGNKGQVVENNKIYNLKNMVSEVFYSLGGLVYLLPVILFLGFRCFSKKSVWVWAGFVFSTLLSIALIVKQHVYIDRNILPFLTALVLITGVMLDNMVNHVLKIDRLKKKTKPAYLYVIIIALIFLPIWGYSKNYLRKIFPSTKSNITNVIEEISNQKMRRLVTIDYPFEDEFIGFSSKKELQSAIPTNGKNFKDFLSNSIGNFQSDDVVLISEINNNKQLTTYVLPSIFNTNRQFDKYFVFYNDIGKDKQFQKISERFNDTSAQSILKDSVVIREDLILREIKIQNGNRIYLKFDVLSTKFKDWNGCRFYFHAKPYEGDLAKLPEDRIEHGFEGWDFTVNENNTLKYGKSLFVVKDFSPTLKKYSEFSFGIFRGCAKSEEFKVNNIILSE